MKGFIMLRMASKIILFATSCNSLNESLRPNYLTKKSQKFNQLSMVDRF